MVFNNVGKPVFQLGIIYTVYDKFLPPVWHYEAQYFGNRLNIPNNPSSNGTIGHGHQLDKTISAIAKRYAPIPFFVNCKAGEKDGNTPPPNGVVSEYTDLFLAR